MAMAAEQLHAKRTELTLVNTTARGIARYIKAEQFDLMEQLMTWKKAKKGSYLFWEGDTADKLYYIRSGNVKLVRTMEEGKNLIISLLQQGDLIAEMHGGLATNHSYSAEAMTDLEVGIIQQKDLDNLFREHGDLALQFMYWFGVSQQIMQSKLNDLLMHGKPGALASTLIRLCNTFGTAKADDSIHIQLKVTNSELGEMIGATRESVNRLLSEWKEDGVLEVNTGKIVVYRLQALRDLCQCPSSPACPLEICRM